MFNSTILDVIVGLITVFLAISLVASALTEAWSTLLGLRAKILLSGVKKLLNDDDLSRLAGDIYNHALVNPLSNGKTAAGGKPNVTPSYIDSRHFAIALIDSVQQAGGDAATLGEAIDKVGDAQVKATLKALYSRAAGRTDAFHEGVSQWFDAAMDRVSGNYTRWTRLFTFVAGLIAAVALNADPVHVVETLWQRPLVAAQLQKIALPDMLHPAKPESDALPIVQEIEAASPVLGWNGLKAEDPRFRFPGVVVLILGWLITAGATLFGASFWFDTLQRFVNLRGTGPVPDPAAPSPAPVVAAAAAPAVEQK